VPLARLGDEGEGRQCSVVGSPSGHIVVSLTVDETHLILDAMQLFLEALTSDPPAQADDAPRLPVALDLQLVAEPAVSSDSDEVL
jgi:hypothetical protein